MRKEDFESIILDYLEDKLSNEDKLLFEAAKNNTSEYQEIFRSYQQIVAIGNAIGLEQYRASPGFKYRVMDSIETQVSQSIFNKIINLIGDIRPNMATNATIAMIVVVSLLLTRPELRQFILQNIGQTIQIQDPNADIDSSPIIIRQSAPLMIARFASTGERLDVTPGAKSKRESAIEDLFNAIGKTFPVGDQIPLGVSVETVSSPQNPSEIIFRSTLYGNGFEQEFGAVAKDIKVEYLINGQIVKYIEPLGSVNERINTPSGRLLWATGQQMIVDQQFTSLGIIGLSDETIKSIGQSQDLLLEVIVRFTDMESLEKQTVRIPVNMSSIITKFNNSSRSMQDAFWWLFQDKLNPGAFSNIDPQAYSDFHKQIEKLVEKGLPTFMDPNQENLANFEKMLKSMKVPNLLKKDYKITVPEEMMKKYPRETLRKMFPPNAVDPDGNPL